LSDWEGKPCPLQREVPSRPTGVVRAFLHRRAMTNFEGEDGEPGGAEAVDGARADGEDGGSPTERAAMIEGLSLDTDVLDGTQLPESHEMNVTKSSIGDQTQILEVEVKELDMTKVPVAKQTQDSARREKLLQKAKEKAEHQEEARCHMLELAQALDEITQKRRVLEYSLKEEKEVTMQKRAETKVIEEKVASAMKRVENLHARRMDEIMPCHESLKFIGLLWSSYGCCPLSVMAPDAATSGPRPKPSRTDYEYLKDWIKLWRSVIAESKIERERGERFAAMQKMWEERLQKAERDWEQKVLREREVTRILRLDLEKLQADRVLLEEALKKLRAENETIKLLSAEEGAKAKGIIDALENKLVRSLQEIAAKEQELEKSEQALVAQEEKFTALEAEAAAQMKALKSQMSTLATDLSQSLTSVKTQKEVSFVAKRGAGNMVSAEKYVQLIMDLETLNDKLGALGRDSEYERARAGWMKSKLEQNSRRLELERQFLPLLHRVRGPVGPRNIVLRSKNQDDWGGVTLGPPPVPPPGGRMSQTMSASQLDNPMKGNRLSSSAGFSPLKSLH